MRMSLYNHIKNRAQMNACDVAIEFEENKITYEELIKQSEELYCRISRYCIFDEGMKCVKVGQSGELYISGVGLSKGYIMMRKLQRKNL